MLTLRAATALLADCRDLASLRALHRHLGFDADPLPLPASLRASVGLDDDVASAEIVAGPGALRACLIDVAAGPDAAALVARLGTRLVSRTPHALWIVSAIQQPATLVIAAAGASTATTVPMLVLRHGRVVDSDAETFVALTAAAPRAGTGLDLVAHVRWQELLGREALNRRFYRVLERRIVGMADSAAQGRSPDDRMQVALLCGSRLLFLAFLQTKGWLDGDGAFLTRLFDRSMNSGGAFHRRALRPLFFGTLNTPRANRAPAARAFGRIPFLNGGLFAPVRAERGPRAPVLADAAVGDFLADVLDRHRFTASEDRTSGTDASVDPEMLGRAFESLMANRERRASGTFFTPPAFVERVAGGALAAALESQLPVQLRAAVAVVAAGSVPEGDAAGLRDAIAALRVLDPACGSGAFLVHALDRLAAWSALAGDVRSPDVIRRALLAHSIFGVDRDPTAVWLCELRLWLAVAVQCRETDPSRVLPLPNLDRNIRVGDALAAPLPGGSGLRVPEADRCGRRIAELRGRYARASGGRKPAAARALDMAERAVALVGADRELVLLAHRRRDVIAARRGRDLFGDRAGSAALDAEAAALRKRAAMLRRDRRRLIHGAALPFRFDVHFADACIAGGFTAIVGNPPWVRLHRIPPADRERLRSGFAVLRHAAWLPGAAAAGAGSGFAGQADLASLFIERSLALLRPGGVMALLVPAKLWTALAGGGVRRLLHDDARLVRIEDCTDAPEVFDAVTYPSIVVAARRCAGETGDADDAADETELAVHRGVRVARWRSPAATIAWDASPGSPWLLLPPPVRSAFEHVRRHGRPIADAGIGRPRMGVKCGHNDAFLVDVVEPPCASPPRNADCALVRDSRGREGLVERALLRPVIRGEHVRQWHASPATQAIVWTHDECGVRRTLPPGAAQWLAPHRARLLARTDSHGSRPWWMLHRTDAASARHARVLWSDMARAPRALWLAPGDPSVPLNTCYVVRCPTLADAQAFTAILNSALAAAWLHALAEPARGGYCRLFAWTVAMLPIPSDWELARRILAPLGAAAGQPGGTEPSGEELLRATLSAYRIRRRDVEALLEWQAGIAS